MDEKKTVKDVMFDDAVSELACEISRMISKRTDLSEIQWLQALVKSQQGLVDYINLMKDLKDKPEKEQVSVFTELIMAAFGVGDGE